MNRIKEIRKSKKITLQDLSDNTGLSIGYLNHLERGTRGNPTITTMNKIAKALNETVEKIFLNKN